MAPDDKALSVPEHDFETFDLADEEQIVAEISGRVTEKYVYQMKHKDPETGQPVVGLSYAGTNWACREYAKQGECIRVDKDAQLLVDPADPDYILIIVRAQRWVIHPETGKEMALDSVLGMKRQSRRMKKNVWENGKIVGEEWVPDPFAWEKCLSKAQRNAKQALIPTDIVKKLVQQALKGKNAGPPRDGGGATATRAASQPSKPAASPAAASQTQASPTQASAPPATAPASGQPPAAAQSKDTLIQKFEVVLKAALGTQDGKVARQGLKKIHGTENIGDLSEEELKKYGAILKNIPKTYKISDDGARVVRVDNGDIVWGKPPEPPKEEQPAATATEGEDALF